jgi:hypothetical protein
MSPVRLVPLFAVWAVAAAPTLFPPKDFVEYWSAARVYLRHGDPYDGAELLPLQREASGDPDLSQATMLWTPPWTLPLYLPFGLLEPRPAHLAWLAVQGACILLSVVLLWRVYDGPTGRSRSARVLWWGVPVGVAVTFAPVWWVFGYGQNTAFVLLGLAGFLYLRRREYLFAAGVVVALTAIKPHVLALFGLALVLNAASRAGRRVLAGGIAALLAASVLTLVPDPDIFRQFLAALARPSSPESPSVADWQLPLLSYHLRQWLAPERFWVQFVPVAVGCGLLVPYWWARRARWDWAAEAPRLVFASVLLAPYGAWVFDLVVLLVPVVQVFARTCAGRRLVPFAVAAAGHLAIFPFVAKLGWLHEGTWVAPAVLIWYLVAAALARAASTRGPAAFLE